MADKDMVALIAAGVPFGLENIGNTCYMNSTVQVTFLAILLRKACVAYDHSTLNR